MEGKKKPKPSLVQKLAEEFIADLQLTGRDPEGRMWTPRSLFAAHAGDVRKSVRSMSPMRLGVIITQGLNREQAKIRGKTSFWEACEEKLNPKSSGRADMRIITTRTIIASMFDILRADDGRATLADARRSRLERDSHGRLADSAPSE
jgi:hypothetical protein